VCFTDVELDDVITCPLQEPDRGYWTSLEVFGADIGNVLGIGLDTVFTGSIDHMFDYSGDLGMLHDPNNLGISINGVLRFPYRPDIWNRYVENKQVMQSRFKNEMAYVASFEHDFIDDHYKGQIYSYKRHVLGGKDTSNTRIVYFHGTPKPKDVAWAPLSNQHT
jgi:hypothetical protein